MMRALLLCGILLTVILMGGCHHGALLKRESECNCPTDIRKTIPWCAGEDAIFCCPCGPDEDFYGHKPTCWGIWPAPGAQWREAYCGPLPQQYDKLEPEESQRLSPAPKATALEEIPLNNPSSVDQEPLPEPKLQNQKPNKPSDTDSGKSETDGDDFSQPEPGLNDQDARSKPACIGARQASHVPHVSKYFEAPVPTAINPDRLNNDGIHRAWQQATRSTRTSRTSAQKRAAKPSTVGRPSPKPDSRRAPVLGLGNRQRRWTPEFVR